jgi:hypothetical protein
MAVIRRFVRTPAGPYRRKLLFLGGSLVIRDFPTAIEADSAQRRDLGSPAEFAAVLTAIGADAMLQLEILAQRRGAPLPIEWFAGIAGADMLAALEFAETIPPPLLSVKRGRLLASPGKLRLLKG